MAEYFQQWDDTFSVGKWSFFQLALLILSQPLVAITGLSYLLIGFQPPFRCKLPDYLGNATRDDFDDECKIRNNSTNESIACPYGFEYAGGKHVSFVAEWDLVCDKGYMAELSQTCYVIGMAAGATIVSHIADRIGRKPMLLVTGCLLGVFYCAASFAPTYEWFIVLRFLVGFFNLGLYDVKIVLIMEMFPARLRGTMIILDGLMWGVSITILACLGYAFEGLNWRHVQLLLMPSFVVIIAYFFFIDESVRWLVANGKYKEAKRILKKMARRNGNTLQAEVLNSETTVPNLEYSGPEEEKFKLNNLQDEKKEEDIAKYNICDILRHKRSRFILLGMCFVWFTNSLTYMGLFLMTTAMSGDRLLNVLLSAAVEVPAMGGLYICNRWLGRRNGCILLHATCSVSLLLAMVFTLTTEGATNDIAMKVVASIGKFAISASFIMIYFYTPELLPTNFRATGLGISSGFARLAAVIAPFSSFVFRKAAWAPGAIFGVLSLLVVVYLIFVPETGDKELPRRLEDIDKWDQEKKLPVSEIEFRPSPVRQIEMDPKL